MNELNEQQAPTVNQDLVTAPQTATATASTSSVEAAESTASTGLTLLNQTQSSAEFRILQGTMQVARIGVAPGGSAKVPMGNDYSVQATTTLGDFTLTSARLSFDATSAQLLAQMKMSTPGLYEFQLVQIAANQPNTLVFENTWREPVQFDITRDGSPMATTMVVDEHNNVTVNTAQQWSIYAIVDGITTETVQTTNPNAAITVVQDNNDDGYSLVVS